LVEAIAQHNIQSIGRLYKNIKIESLGHLLELEPCKAELMVGRMISEGRIDGSIDQKDGFITFNCKSHFCVISFSMICYNDLLLPTQSETQTICLNLGLRKLNS